MEQAGSGGGGGEGGWLVKWVGSGFVSMDYLFVCTCGGIPQDIFSLFTISVQLGPTYCVQSAGVTPPN